MAPIRSSRALVGTCRALGARSPPRLLGPRPIQRQGHEQRLATVHTTAPALSSFPSSATNNPYGSSAAPPGAFGGSGGSPAYGYGYGPPAVPASYFAKPSLPANTIIRFVPQQTAWIVERMGKFHRILQPGLAILIPFLDRIAYVKSLKENAIEIPSQSAITADNVTLELDGILYTRVLDAYKARSAAFSLPGHCLGLEDLGSFADTWSPSPLQLWCRGRRVCHLPAGSDDHA